ncbi:hypothetical protein M011DRAFT_466257 [Sporormia fimetaria CBS 119925]|uniref:Uncharacterized protein n=1 Tax=Sporormia fimetaria CBS 119925 TaxID=1340428 RepID=A0A6A6VJ46_9PLEO|nr:hypothetical protein M011DRAFT_466257 [Sporormia fimetaria CBS 119925]
MSDFVLEFDEYLLGGLSSLAQVQLNTDKPEPQSRPSSLSVPSNPQAVLLLRSGADSHTLKSNPDIHVSLDSAHAHFAGSKVEVSQEWAMGVLSTISSLSQAAGRSMFSSHSTGRPATSHSDDSTQPKREKFVHRPSTPHPSVPTISPPRTEFEKDFDAVLARRRAGTVVSGSPASSIRTQRKFLRVRIVSWMPENWIPIPDHVPLVPSWEATVVFIDDGLQTLDKLKTGVKSLCVKFKPRRKRKAQVMKERGREDAKPVLQEEDSDDGESFFMDENCQPVDWRL